jgi:hypothetical protein
MRAMKLLQTVALTTVIVGVPQTSAQKIDLSMMKCREFLQVDYDKTNIIMTWLLAYYTDPNAPTVIDLAKLSDMRDKFSSFCSENPNFDVATAAEGILGK